MIRRTRAHLQAAGETYWQHFRFATTFGLISVAAGFAAMIHAVVPGFCTTTASQLTRHLGRLIEDRSAIEAIEREAIEASAFVLLLGLATVVVTPLWMLDVPTGLRMVYTVLAYAMPFAVMFTNPELMASEETPA